MAGCRRDPVVTETRGVARAVECAAATGPDAYLPRAVLWPPDELPRILRDDYSTLLAAIDEPSLFCGNGIRSEAYRLARLEWAGVPLVVRFEPANTTGTMRVLKLEAPSWNFPPGLVIEQRTVALETAATRELVGAIERADLWAMPTTSRAQDTGLGEGTTWILEASRDGRYHVVSRWLPGPDSRLVALARTIMRHAGVTEGELKGDAPGVVMRPPRPQRGDPPPPPG